MRFVADDIMEYCEQYSKPAPPVLHELERETHLKQLMPQMLAGHLQGALLRMFSLMIQPEKVLEIGTFTGYSAICLAAGLKPKGVLHTIDMNEELKDMIDRYLKKAEVEDKVSLHIGAAKDIIPTIEGPFDLVYIDADKESYPQYYDLIFDKVRDGGYIIADNTLWSGKVIEQEDDPETVGVHAFNKKVREDERVENVLLPVRDGIMIIRKSAKS